MPGSAIGAGAGGGSDRDTGGGGTRGGATTAGDAESAGGGTESASNRGRGGGIAAGGGAVSVAGSDAESKGGGAAAADSLAAKGSSCWQHVNLGGCGGFRAGSGGGDDLDGSGGAKPLSIASGEMLKSAATASVGCPRGVASHDSAGTVCGVPQDGQRTICPTCRRGTRSNRSQEVQRSFTGMRFSGCAKRGFPKRGQDPFGRSPLRAVPAKGSCPLFAKRAGPGERWYCDREVRRCPGHRVATAARRARDGPYVA